MNIATLLQFLATGSLDPGLDLDKERGPCTPYAEDAVSCIRNDAGLSYKMAKMCVLCPFKNARKSGRETTSELNFLLVSMQRSSVGKS